jgi:predicted esterase YcpF (UPF0227 family)
MVLYIHGFGGSGLGSKAGEFRKFFNSRSIEYLSPSLSFTPTLAIDTLTQLLEYLLKKDEDIKLIGSSLGGYYSIYLSQKYDLKTVLINPSIYPYKTLERSVSDGGINFFDCSKFEWSQTHLAMLKYFQIKEPIKQSNFLTLLKKGDDLLDYKEASEIFTNTIIDEGGDHGYSDIADKFEIIKEFLKV